MKAALLALLVALAAPAQADTLTYSFAGMLQAPHGAYVSDLRPWSGTLEVELDSLADGMHAAELDIVSTEGSWSTTGTAMASSGSLIDIAGSFIHQVYLPFGWYDPCASLVVDNMRIDYSVYVSSIYGGSASLLAVTPIPEPSTYALMLAGLASIVWLRRRRSA